MIKIFKINLIFFLIVIASPASYSNSDMSDPYENSNRSIHEFNDKIDVYLLRPVSVGYSLLPNPIEDGISNILQNSGEPINFTNYILQGEIKNALSSLMRFIINSSFGLLGTFDLADQLNLKRNDTDFDHTTLRKYVDFLDEDRPLYKDHDAMKDLVSKCTIIDNIKTSIGPLYKK